MKKINIDLFFKNLEVINKIDNELYNIINSKVKNIPLEKYFSTLLKKLNFKINDNLEIVFNNKIILSNRVLENISNQNNLNLNKAVIIKFVYNFYLLEIAIKKLKNNIPIIIIIENLNLFIIYLGLKDLSFLDNNLPIYVTSKNEKLNLLFLYNGIKENKVDLFIINNIKYFYLKPLYIYNNIYEKYFENEIKILFNFIVNKITFIISDALTYVYLLFFQIKSILKNLKHINKTLLLPKTNQEIEKIKRTLNKKAIIISAGFSLSSLDFVKIKKLQKIGFYIIAVDTAYRILKYNNIIPDITIILDSQILNYYDFLFLKPENEFFLIDISANYKIIEKIKEKNTLLFFSSVLMNIKNEWSAPSILAHQIINSSNLAKIPTFGNITLAALSFANYFFNEILVFGFDRGFTKYIYHCKHSLDYYYFFKNQNFLNSFLNFQIKFSLSKLKKHINKNKKSSLTFNKLDNIFQEKFSEFKNIKIISEKDYNTILEDYYKKEKYNINENDVEKNIGKNKKKYIHNFLRMFETRFVLKENINYKNTLELLENSIDLYYNFEKFKFKKQIFKILKNH